MAIFDKDILDNDLEWEDEEFEIQEFSYEYEKPVLIAYEHKNDCEFEFNEEALNSTVEYDIWQTISYDKDEVKDKIIADYAKDVEISREEALKIIVSKTLGNYEEYIGFIKSKFGFIEFSPVEKYVDRTNVQYNTDGVKVFIANLIKYLQQALEKYPTKKEEISEYIEMIKSAFNRKKINEIVDQVTRRVDKLDYRKNEEILRELKESKVGLKKIDRIIVEKGYHYTLEEIYSMVPSEVINDIFFYGSESEQYITFINKFMNLATVHCLKLDGTKYDSQEITNFMKKKYNSSYNWTALEEFSQGLYGSEYEEYIDFSKLIK